MKVSIIGCGRAGRALGRRLREAKHEVVAVTCRTPERAVAAAAFVGARTGTADLKEAAKEAELVLICVPDDAIREVSAHLRPRGGAVVAHVSGVHSADILKPHRKRGAVHSMVSFADPERAAREFAGTFCAVDGVAEAVSVLEEVVRSIGGIPLKVRSDRKALYHAGAVFASNYVVTAFGAALRLLRKAGVPREEAQRALSALTAGTAKNLESVGVPDALTGPIERGDVGTLRAHVEAISTWAPDLAGTYSELARTTVEIAFKKGSFDRATAGKLNGVLGNMQGQGVYLSRPGTIVAGERGKS